MPRSPFVRFCVVATLLVAQRSVFAQEGAKPGTLAPPKDKAFQQDVAWSPDGKAIAFSEYASDGEFNPQSWKVHIINVDGSGRRLLVANAMFVTWSRDGKQLAFGSGRDGEFNVYKANADGTGITNLTDNPGRDNHPAWSPSGDRIAFSSVRERNQDIYVMTADGSAVTRLTTDAAKDYNPAWSPKGDEIVFFRDKGDGMDQIHVVSADGSRERQITQDEKNNVFPSFASDGRIAYIAGGKDQPNQLMTVAPDGKDPRRVGEPSIAFARWSPGGKQIAFVAGKWPQSAVYIMNADGSGVRKLVN